MVKQDFQRVTKSINLSTSARIEPRVTWQDGTGNVVPGDLREILLKPINLLKLEPNFLLDLEFEIKPKAKLKQGAKLDFSLVLDFES